MSYVAANLLVLHDQGQGRVTLMERASLARPTLSGWQSKTSATSSGRVMERNTSSSRGARPDLSVPWVCHVSIVRAQALGYTMLGGARPDARLKPGTMEPE
jgi:hypothetical protein